MENYVLLVFKKQNSKIDISFSIYYRVALTAFVSSVSSLSHFPDGQQGRGGAG